MNTLTVQINDFLYYVGVNDRDTHLFENMWPLDHGVSYNSYIIKGEKTALMDTVKIMKVDNFMGKVREVIGDRDLDYLIVHHMEPDHSGSIQTIIDNYPNVTLVGNKKTTEFLREFYGITENILEVKEGDTLDLGDHSLTFYMTPMVHWPESMVSFEKESGILFSQDAFGGFGALNGTIFDDEIDWDFFANETRRYYTNIVGKFSKNVQSALKKLSPLDIKMVCPVHGPIWRTHPEKIIRQYDELSRYQTEEGVVIVYGSMYGNTEAMAEVIARELAVQGIKKIQIIDVSKTHESYVLNEVWKYRGLILGSCTYNNSLFPIMAKLVHVLDINKIENHTLGIFGSYSWSGGAVKALKEFAEKGKYDVLETVVEARCSANEENHEDLKKMAREMADKLMDIRLEETKKLLHS